MLGEQLGELKGNVTAKRVLDVENDPTVEVSVSREGKLKGVDATEMLTYYSALVSDGTLRSHGQGVIMTKDGSDTATFTGRGIGRFTGYSTLRYIGSSLFGTSKGKLEFLNNSVTVFEVEENIKTSSHQIKMWKWE